MWHWHAVLFPRANGERESTGHDSAEGTVGSCLNRQNFAITIGKPVPGGAAETFFQADDYQRLHFLSAPQARGPNLVWLK